jgi:hypothetical protein
MRYCRRKKITDIKDIFIAFLILSFTSSVYAKIIPIYPDMQVSSINQQLNSSNPGDTLLFYPGIYKGPFVLEEVNGDLNNPIVIMGKMDRRKKLVTVDGKAQPGMNLENFAFCLKNILITKPF